VPTQLHPSIIAQPLINKEKEKEKELRDKEHASTSNPNIEAVESVEIDDSDSIIPDRKEIQNTNDTLTKLENEKTQVDKPPEISKRRTSRRLQMIADQEPYDVIQDLNTLKCNININIAQLLDLSPKVKAKLMQGLKFEKNQTKISDAQV